MWGLWLICHNKEKSTIEFTAVLKIRGTQILIIASSKSDWELSTSILHGYVELYRHVIYHWKAQSPSFTLGRGIQSCIRVYGSGTHGPHYRTQMNTERF